ncbi:hypothetical protein GGI43DRAFT_425262 [Trichoderma evansii]
MGIWIEGASRAELVRCVICLAIFSRPILARLGLFACFFLSLFIFGVPSFLCFSFSVASPLFHAARPRLMPVCPLEIDYMASLFLVVAIRWDVCWEEEEPRARSSAQARTGHSLRSRRRSLGLRRKLKKPLFVDWQLLIIRPCCLCFNPLFHSPREVDKGGSFVIDDGQNILDTAAAAGSAKAKVLDNRYPVLVSCSACSACTYLPWRCCYPRLRDRYGRFALACVGLCGVPPAPKCFCCRPWYPAGTSRALAPLLPPDSRLRPSAAASRSIDKKFSLRCDLMQLLALGS